MRRIERTLTRRRQGWPLAALLLAALLLASLLLVTLAAGCNDGDALLRAKQIESQTELIGGPTARGKLGDFLLENDRIRAIVAGYGATWAAGIFGGTLVDLDLRRTRAEYAYGHGKDAFAESFPTLNLIIVDPESELRRLQPKDGGGFEMVLDEARIEVVKDGSDGEQAVVRVQGAGGYLFDVLKYLNRGFLDSFLNAPLDLAALLPESFQGILRTFGVDSVYIPALVKALPTLAPILSAALGLSADATAMLQSLDIDLYRLMERLKIDFDFQTDYVLAPGDDYLTIRTTIRLAPPSRQQLDDLCPPIECAETCPEAGYVMEETLVDCPEDQTDRCKVELKGLPGLKPAATKLAAFCPVCECATAQTMPAMTESRSVFNDILGTSLGDWMDPSWRSGLIAGDFLFFGGECNIFTPGLGFDEDRRIFENMWQGVGTIGNPLTFDFVAGVAGDKDVSYALVTRNPDERIGAKWAECPEYRYALVWADPDQVPSVVDALVALGWNRGQASGAVRGLVVERQPITLEAFETTSVADRPSLDAFRAGALGATRGQEITTAFGDAAELGVLPHLECQAAQLLVPLFTTSATVVVTHEALGGLVEEEDGTIRDPARVYTYERYLVVGEGDVGSLLDTVYELRGEPYGFVAGAALEAQSLRPISRADVFAVRDPRPVIETLSEARKARLPAIPGDPSEWDYDFLVRLNREVFGRPGIVSHMLSDLGDDPTLDGDFSGALAPGDWFLVAKAANRPVSALVPLRVEVGETAKANVLLEAPARVDYRVVDGGGALVPAKLTFVSLDPATREPLTWDGRNLVELGDGRSDYGVREVVLAAHGSGSVEMEPGLYRIYASRGIEFDIAVEDAMTLKPGQTHPLELRLLRSVDTRGWLSGDFHLHARPSVDAGLMLVDRVLSLVAEGVEFATSTDHDVVTDYRPILNALDLYQRVGFQAGVETSSLEFGHYNVYPLVYDDRKGEAHDPPPWQFRRTGEVFREMRERGLDGPAGTVVQINHPRDGFMGYFAQAGLNGLTLERDTPGMEACNPATVEIPCDFDAIEVMNERRFELIRTPSIAEVADYNGCLTAIIGADDRTRFSVAAADGAATPIDASASVCGALQALPEGCEELLAGGKPALHIQGEERARWVIDHDHCLWHDEFQKEMARAAQASDMLSAKRVALEALKLLSVRYMLERTPQEQAALQFFREHPAWDPGCDLAKANAGCAARPTEDGASFETGCAKDPADCGCHLCVCGTADEPGIMPECCKDPAAADDPGTGWTAQCAAACRDECHSCGDAPCTDRFQVVDDWMGMLNQGLDVTAMGNSDSHGLLYEAGMPRNFLRAAGDDPATVDLRDIDDAILKHRVVISSGPFLEVTLNDAGVGDTVVVPPTQKIAIDIRVQTPRWFGIDRVEIYRNGSLEEVIPVDAAIEDVVDLQTSWVAERPAIDSWYVVMAYGLNGGRTLEPVYRGIPYGHILLPTVLSLATAQLLAPFQDLLDSFSGFLDVAGLFGGDELPDSFPVLPFAMTNAIRVDLDGDGWDPPDAPDWDGDGKGDLPGFCTQPCALEKDADGLVVEAQSTCPLGQVCLDDGTGDAGRCAIPISPECVDGDWGNDLSVVRAPLTADGTAAVKADGAVGAAHEARDAGLDGRARLSRQFEQLLRERLTESRGPRRRLPLPRR